MEASLKKVIFTCGGTAGHVNPAIALAQLMREKDPETEFLFVGAERGLEKDLIPKAGYDFRTVHISSFHRSFKPREIRHNLVSVGNLLRAPGEARAILRQFRPDVVIGTGGYASFPMVKAAAKAGIPTAVHESNMVPGLTTEMLEPFADRIMVGFEACREHYRHPEKVIVTGTPVRRDFFHLTKAEAKRRLGVEDGRPLLVSFWGSLGASGMNRQMADFLVLEAAKEPFHHIHGAGRDYPWMQEELLRRGLKLGDNGVEVREYIYDMPLVMAAADLVLCRAGASTIAEIAAIAKPAVLVPSPNVVADHQTKNARALADRGAALLIPDAEAVEKALPAALVLAGDLPRREELERNIRTMATPDAAQQVASEIIKLARRP